MINTQNTYLTKIISGTAIYRGQVMFDGDDQPATDTDLAIGARTEYMN